MEQMNNEQNIYNAALYCRLTKDDEQAGESVSIGTQKMILEKFCKEHDFHIVGVYVDDGFLGLNFEGPEFQRMLKDIEDGKINLVITKDLSRLGRDYIQTGYYTEVYFVQKRVRGAITGGKNSNVCFVAGTSILTSIGYVVIEDISVGDKVWSENPETGEKELKEVVQTFVNETEKLVHVHANGEEIVTTPEHPFYVPKKGWVGSIDLRAGDILVLQSGEYVVVEMVQHEILELPITVYNFEVEDFHTYYVGINGILVHNMCKKVTSVLYH